MLQSILFRMSIRLKKSPDLQSDEPNEKWIIAKRKSAIISIMTLKKRTIFVTQLLEFILRELERIIF